MKNHGNQEKAIRNTFHEVGQAIIFTSIILSVGFLIFLNSTNKGFNYFGAFSATSLFASLLANLFLLPAMIRLFFFQKTENNHSKY